MSARNLTIKTDQVDSPSLTGGETSLQGDYESIVGSLRFGINTSASKSYREPPRTFVTIYESHLSEAHRDYKVTEVLFDQLRMAHQTCVWVKGQDSEGNEAVFAIPETATRTRPDEIRVRAELVTVSDIREIIQPRREDAKHFRKILLQSIYLNGPPLPPLLERILGSAIVDTRLECERV